MKAAVWVGDNEIVVKDVEMPVIGEEEALLKVRCAGICATDYHIISGKLRIGNPPNVQGHEICAEVYKINTERDDIKVGDRCVVATSLGCGHCEYCRCGKQYLCKDSSEIGFYPHSGGYAEYVKVPVSAIVKIPDTVSDYAGSILESIVCPTESLMNFGVPFNGTVFVTGCGPAGLAYIMLSKIMGAKTVICLVRGEARDKRVMDFGCDIAIDSTVYPDVYERLMELTNGEGAELVIEATGAPSIIEATPSYTKKGGKIILYGIPGDNEVVNVPIKKLVVNEITMHGAVGNTKAWYPLVELIDKGKINLEKMITHEFTLDDIDKAFDLYRNHDKTLIKAVIKF